MKTKILLIALTAFCFSCKKNKICDTKDLPCQTHEGKNTFGCYINGEPFVAKTSFSIGGAVPVSGSFDENTKLLILQGSREDASEKIESVNFFVYVNGTGVHTMWANTANYEGYSYFNSSTCTYYHDMINKGTVNISYLDSESNIISGTFNMTLINPDCTSNQTMEITLGRFDFGY